MSPDCHAGAAKRSPTFDNSVAGPTKLFAKLTDLCMEKNKHITYKIDSIMALEFTDTNFQEKVISSDKLTIVDFWAEWCGPCRAIGPVIEELSKEYDGKINVGKVNVDHNPQLSVNYGITSIPAILFIKGGKVVDKLVGAQPKSNFVKKIDQHL